MENDAEKKLINTNEGVQLANKAILLDLKDGYSWYVLGNAHLTRFFIGGQDYEELNFALKAYTQAEHHSSYKNPDLYYNRAQIFSYLENYQKAIADFEAAHLIDPELNGHERAGKLIEFIKQCSYQVKNKSKGVKKLGKIAKTVPAALPPEEEIKFPSS